MGRKSWEAAAIERRVQSEAIRNYLFAIRGTDVIMEKASFGSVSEQRPVHVLAEDGPLL
jgi:hypothetical protein